MLDAQAQRVPVGPEGLSPVTSNPPRSPVTPHAGDGGRQAEWIEAVKRLIKNRKGALGALILLLLVVLAAAGRLLMPFDPNELHLVDQLAPPSPTYWFGADELGRDILSRVIAGAPVALEAGVLATLLAGIVGTATGIPAAYFGGWYDAVIMRFWDTMLALPAIFVAIAIVAVLGTGSLNAIVAVAIINMPAFARLARATTLATMEKEFVLAARALGATAGRIMSSAILPNLFTVLVVQMAVAAPQAIVTEAALSFLGLGSQPPDATWGNMLSDAQGYLAQAPSYGIFPGLAIVIVVVGINFFADGLQDALDPRRVNAAAKVG